MHEIFNVSADMSHLKRHLLLFCTHKKQINSHFTHVVDCAFTQRLVNSHHNRFL